MVPHFQLIQFDNEDGTKTISGLVVQFEIAGWLEGVNNRLHQHYDYRLIFEQDGGFYPICILSQLNLNIELPALITIVYRESVGDTGETVRYMRSYSISKALDFKTQIKTWEPEFFTGG